MGKALLFVRVSTQQQHLESQEDSLRRAAIADGYSEPDIVVIGKKESAIKLDEEEREGLNELKEQLAKGNIDCIYIFELSRLSRRPKILYSLREQFLATKVQLKCLKPQFTLLTNDRCQYDQMASIVFSLFGAMAEQEMIEKKERFHRGRRRLAEEGRFNGGNIPFGYRKDPERGNLIVIDEDDAAIVREVFNLYEGGVSQPQLAKEYYRRGNKKLTISFINNILNNKRYTGDKHCYPGSSFERSYPFIITPEQYERCRQIAKKNNTTANKAKNIYYANKLIVCTNCGCYWSASGSKVLYHCYDAFNPMRKYEHYVRSQCTCRLSISINIMDSLLWHIAQDAEVHYILHAAKEEREHYEHQVEILTQKILNIQPRLKELDDKQSRIVDSFIEGLISKEKRDERLSSITSERKEILLDQMNFTNEINHIQDLLNDLENRYDLNDVNSMMTQLEHNMAVQNRVKSIEDDAERFRIVQKHIKKVTVENSEIVYTFGIGTKLTKTRFITVELYVGETLYFHYLPSTGKGSVTLRATADGKPIEKVSFQYLDRYFDEGKRRRHQEARERDKYERTEHYPPEKYVLSYSGLAKFLNVSMATAHRWVATLGILRPAVVDHYRKEIVVDKEKCMAILKEEASHNIWAQRILDNMDCKEG